MFYLSKYIKEIKYRLFLILVNCTSTILICLFYKEIFLFLIIPDTYINKDEQLAFFYFIFTDVKEILSVYFVLIIFLSFQITFFFFAYHFFAFINPALFKSEFLRLKYYVQFLVLVWLISIIAVTYILIPLTWNFFLSFQIIASKSSFTLHFEAKIKEYIYFYTRLYFLCWFYCHFFLFFVIYFSFEINIVNIKKYRRIYHYCFIIFSTMISSPEILGQIFSGLIIIEIYELLLFFFIVKFYLKNLKFN